MSVTLPEGDGPGVPGAGAPDPKESVGGAPPGAEGGTGGGAEGEGPGPGTALPQPAQKFAPAASGRPQPMQNCAPIRAPRSNPGKGLVAGVGGQPAPYPKGQGSRRSASSTGGAPGLAPLVRGHSVGSLPISRESAEDPRPRALNVRGGARSRRGPDREVAEADREITFSDGRPPSEAGRRRSLARGPTSVDRASGS